MKKTYILPEICIEKMSTQGALLLSTSQTKVSGSDGGWVKEYIDDVWDDDDWSE